jgi:hypothetical protein
MFRSFAERPRSSLSKSISTINQAEGCLRLPARRVGVVKSAPTSPWLHAGLVLYSLVPTVARTLGRQDTR